RTGEKKFFNISVAGGQTRLSWERIAEEIAKCDVVCANCHRIRTHERRIAERKEAARQVEESADLSESCCSSGVERFIGNEEVVGPIPTSSSRYLASCIPMIPAVDRGLMALELAEERWLRKSSSGPSRTSTSGRSATSTTARPR